MGLSVGVHDGLKVLLVLFAALPVDPDHRLAAARHRGLALRMDPRQNLHTDGTAVVLKLFKLLKPATSLRPRRHLRARFNTGS